MERPLRRLINVTLELARKGPYLIKTRIVLRKNLDGIVHTGCCKHMKSVHFKISLYHFAGDTIIINNQFAHKIPTAWVALVALAMVSTFLANTLYYLGLKSFEAGRAFLVATLEPVIAAVILTIYNWVTIGPDFSQSRVINRYNQLKHRR